MKFFSKRNLFVTLLSVLIVSLLAVISLNMTFLNPVTQGLKDFSVNDMFYQISNNSGEAEMSNAVTIVDMTNLYKRSEIANALEEIESHHPAVIGVDVVFEGVKDEADGGDSMLVNVAKKYDNIIYSHRLLDYTDYDKGYTTDIHSFFVDSVKVTEGFTNMKRELYGGIKRKLTLHTRVNGETIPSFLVQLVSRFVGEDIPEMEDEDLDINFMPMSFSVIDYDSISYYPELIEDRMVLFGAMYEEGDMQYTPLGKMAGVKLLAYGAETLLNQKEVRYIPWWLLYPLIFVLVYVTFWILDNYIHCASQMKNRVVGTILSSDYFVGILLFLWMVLLMGGAAYVFGSFNVSINIGWAFAMMVFLSASSELYEALLEVMKKR